MQGGGLREPRRRLDERLAGLIMAAELRQRLCANLGAGRALRIDRQTGLGRRQRGVRPLLPGIGPGLMETEKAELEVEKRILGRDPDGLFRVGDRGVPSGRPETPELNQCHRQDIVGKGRARVDLQLPGPRPWLPRGALD